MVSHRYLRQIRYCQQRMLQHDIFIGKVIRDEVHRQGVSIVELSQRLNCSRQRIYDIFGRHVLDSQTLWQLSVVLNTDFFKLFSNALYDKGDDSGNS